MTAVDPVMVDSYVCSLLGYDTEEVEYIGLAEELSGDKAASSTISSVKTTDNKEIKRSEGIC